MKNEKIQKRIENIVKNEVLTCQSSLVEMLLNQGIVNYEDITNLYIDNNEGIEEKKDELEELIQDEKYEELNEKNINGELTAEEEDEYNNLQQEIDNLESKIQELEEEQENPQEIYEWWVVSSWLADELEEHGEPILKSDYGIWWGRTCTGQSITLDYVIEKIITDIENKYN